MSADLTGRRFGKLVVLGFHEKSAKVGDSLWLVQCECDRGVQKIVARRKLLSGHTKSCGCLRKPHGMFGTPEYKAWVSLIQRCTNPKARGWERYGGRGISVCREWAESFQPFFQHVGSRPTARHSLDRFPDPDGNYEPGNVRWATAKEQQRNTSANRRVCVGELDLTVAEWAERTGLQESTIRERLKRGWDVSLAVRLPADRCRPHVVLRKSTKRASRGEDAARHAKENNVSLADAARLYGVSRQAVQQKWRELFGATTPPARRT